MSLSTRPKRRAATNVAKIIEISDSDDNFEGASPEKRQRTIKVTARRPDKESLKTSNENKETKTRKPRTKKPTKEVSKNDENTPPNVATDENVTQQAEEVGKHYGNTPPNVATDGDVTQQDVEPTEDLTDGQCLQPETANTSGGLNDDSLYDEQPQRQRIQGRNSFWGKFNVQGQNYIIDN